MEVNKVKVLAFAGSTRKESLNRILLQHATELVKVAGGKVNLLDLEDYPLPLYNGDIEKTFGLPENAVRLKNLFLENQGLLIASPEYNSSITPLLKNTIDWVSRPRKGESSLECFNGKVCALISASPGALGGIRALYHLRTLLSNIKVIVCPEIMAVPKADQAFSIKGNLIDSKLEDELKKLCTNFVKLTYKFTN